MNEEFPEFELLFDKENKIVRWEGILKILEKNYRVKINYPNSYPFVQPTVFVFSKNEEGQYHLETFSNTEHRFKDGSICLFTWDEGEWGWKPYYAASEVLYKLITFVDLYTKGKISRKHFSSAITGLSQYNSGIIFPTKYIQGIQDSDYGTLGLYPITKRTLIVHNMTIKSKEKKKKIITFDIELQASLDFKSLKWFYVSPSLYNKISECYTDEELNTILQVHYKEWIKNDFSQIVLFLTSIRNEVSKDNRHLSFCVFKPPDNKSLLEKVHVSWGNWDDLYADRMKNMIGKDLTILDNHVVCLIGVGSLGSEIAVQLARSGVKNFIIVDPDILVVENLSRHVLDIRYLHEYKAIALKDFLSYRNLGIKVVELVKNVLEPMVPFEIIEIGKIMKKKVILVCTTANLEVEYLINSISITHGIPAIYSYCNNKVQMGRILRVIPGKTPCFHCFAEACRDKKIPIFPEDEEIILHSPYELGLPGVGIDIAEIAVFASRIVLQTILEANKKKSKYPTIEFDNLLKVIHPVAELRPDLYPAELIRDEKCVFCGKTDIREETLRKVEKGLITGRTGSIKKGYIIEIPKELSKIITNAAEVSYEEKCGIVVGYSKKNSIKITHLLEDRSTNNRSRYGVTRTIKEIWPELNTIAKDTSSDYIGEWHTHPFGSSYPSITDIIGMQSILENRENLDNLSEVLLIIGSPKKDPKVWLFFRDETFEEVEVKICN